MLKLRFSTLILLFVSLCIFTFGISRTTHAAVVNQGTTTKIATGLAGYWTFDGLDVLWNTLKVKDRVGNSTTNTMEGMSTSSVRVGVMGQSLYFNGTNSDINIGPGSNLNLTDNYSINFWIYPNNNFTGTALRVSNGLSNTTSLNKYEIRVLTTGVLFITGDGTDFDSDAFSTVLDASKWTMITCTMQSNLKSCYKNAILISTSTNDVDTSILTATTGFIGTNRNSASNNFYEGRLDDLRVYNRVISTSEIQHLYNLGNEAAAVSSSRGLRATPGLLAYWTFDGVDLAQNVADKSANARHGFLTSTIATSTAVTPGKVGQAFKFNGASYVSTPLQLPNTAFSLSFWIKGRPTDTVANLFAQDVAGEEIALSYVPAAEAFSYENNYNTADSIGGWNYTLDNNWHHIVLVESYAGTDVDNASFYIDGVLQSSLYAGTIQSINTGNLVIGARPGGSNFYKGAMDDIRAYNRALTAAEVKTLYNLGNTATKVNTSLMTRNTSGLVGYWTFDGPDLLQNVVDKSGQGNTGTISGIAATSSAVVPGKVGQALNFDGTDDQIIVSDTDTLTFGNGTTDSPFTFSVWVKRKTPSTTCTLISKTGTTAANTPFEYLFAYLNTDKLFIRLYDSNGSNRIDLTSNASFSSDLNAWVNYVVTYNGSGVNGLSLYRNGVAAAGTTGSAGTYVAMENSTQPFRIGASFPSDGSNKSFMCGSMDDVRVYNRALTAAEVLRLYDSGL